MSKRLTTEQFIEQAKSRHGERYNYSKVDYKNRRDKVIIICKEHGEFKQKPYQHTIKGSECPKCTKQKGAHNRLTKGIFIERSKLVHGDKYDYSKSEYNTWDNPITIICKQHGEFQQRAGVHLCGMGCGRCGIEQTMKKLRSTKSEFVEKAKTIHGDNFDYNSVDYTNNETKVVIICRKHGEFKQVPYNHLMGQGCPKCRSELRVSKVEIAFLDYLNVPKENRNYPIGKYFVDGVVNNTIYEFLGDYWHGHNRLENGLNHIDIQIKRMLTQVRFEQLQKLTGFNIKYVWEADWNEYKKLGGHLKLRTFKDRLTID